MKRVLAYLNPADHREGLTWLGLYALAASLLVALFVLRPSAGSRLQIGPMIGTDITSWTSAQPTAPAETAFHLAGVRTVVYSYYAWDSGVLGTSAVADWDYLLPYGWQEPARLPGGPWITYHILGWGYIPGSGTYVVIEAPNGGRFAYFHLQYASYRDVMHGGGIVGRTMWPTWSEYAGGGSPGPIDAHLCVAPDALAADFLQHLPANPHTFHAKKWNAYRIAHHERTIPFWRDGRLIWSASVWRFHQNRLGGITRKEQWFGPDKHRRLGFEKDSFAHGSIFLWPKTGATKVIYHKS